MPWTACPRERRCFEPSPLVKARARLPTGHRCCPLLTPASCPEHAPRALIHRTIVGRGRRHRRLGRTTARAGRRFWVPPLVEIAAPGRVVPGELGVAAVGGAGSGVAEAPHQRRGLGAATPS